MKKLFVVLFLLLALPAVAAAQIPNPTRAEFTPSPDHPAVDTYEIGWFLSGAADPVSTVDLGKPTPDATNTCSVAINVMPLPFNVYTAKVRAKVGTLASEWSDPSNVFVRVPGKPGKPTIK